MLSLLIVVTRSLCDDDADPAGNDGVTGKPEAKSGYEGKGYEGVHHHGGGGGRGYSAGGYGGRGGGGYGGRGGGSGYGASQVYFGGQYGGTYPQLFVRPQFYYL